MRVNKRIVNKCINKLSFSVGKDTFNVYLGKLAGTIPIEKKLKRCK